MNTTQPNNSSKKAIPEACAEESIQNAGITGHDSSVSYLLDQIPDKPKKIYISGNPSILNDPGMKFLCVIGSRKHTSYGQDACEHLMRALKGHKVAIVSGLALGIDGLAHALAMENGLPCIAVPGSGIDMASLYPRSHVHLAEQILSTKDGILLSEFEPGTRASPWSFPMRNRIMAGLSHAVLIIEGEEDSGTLITAKLALEYNRDVFAIPGSIFSQTSRGPLNLIKNGAVPICSQEDLLSALGIQKSDSRAGSLFEDHAGEREAYVRLTDEERSVIETLDEPRDKDSMQQKSGLPISKMQIVLSMLEVKDVANELYGKIHLTERGKNIFKNLNAGRKT